jgi:hypothetical protein
MKRCLGALLLLCSVPAFACKGHLYNLTSGQVTEIKCGHRKASGTLPSGEKLAGEYVTIVNAAVGWGSIYSSVYSASSTAVSVAGQNRGTVIMTGNQGTILNCEYLSSSWSGHGAGAGEDNQGVKYKLMF